MKKEMRKYLRAITTTTVTARKLYSRYWGENGRGYNIDAWEYMYDKFNAILDVAMYDDDIHGRDFRVLMNLTNSLHHRMDASYKPRSITYKYKLK